MTDHPTDAAETGPIDAAEDEAAELRQRWHRALAEAENTRKWADRRMAEHQHAERVRATAAWLPVLDNLDLALRHAEADPGAIVEGIAQIREQANQVLDQLGFQPIDETGVPFDPQRHEAAEVIAEDPAPAGTVVRVIRAGYGHPSEPTGLLRPAIVAVSANIHSSGDGDDGG